MCAGKHQSPINIITKDAIRVRHPYALHLKHWDEKPLSMKIENEIVAIRIIFKYPEHKVPTIKGGPLHSTYKLVGVHFHMGDVDGAGSDHKINGRSGEGEVHMVYINKKYTPEQAKTHHDGYVVLGRLITIDKKWAHFESQMKYSPFVEKVIEGHTTYDLKFPNTHSLETIFGNRNFNFYTYTGSFTTPDCSEAVRFIIASEPMKITKHDWKIFREVKGFEDYVFPNYRPIQPLNGRKVRYYKY